MVCLMTSFITALLPWQSCWFSIIHLRGEYFPALAMKSMSCAPRWSSVRKRPVCSLMKTREPTSASLNMPAGVVREHGLDDGDEEPSRLDMMRFTVARAMQSKTTSSGRVFLQLEAVGHTISCGLSQRTSRVRLSLCWPMQTTFTERGMSAQRLEEGKVAFVFAEVRQHHDVEVLLREGHLRIDRRVSPSASSSAG